MMVIYDWFRPFFMISGIVSAQSPGRESQLVSCVVAVCKQDFTQGQVLVLDEINLIGDYQATLLRALHSLVTWTLILENSQEPPGSIKKKTTIAPRDDCYILFTCQDDFVLQISRMRSRTTWNSRALFLVVFTRVTNRTLQVFEGLWRYKVANVIIVIPSADASSTTVNIYSWFPYQQSSCGEAVKINDVVLVNHWENGRFLHDKHIFTTKVPNDLHDCPVFVSTFPWPPFVINVSLNDKEVKYRGLEIEMMNTIGEAGNFTPVYLPPPPHNTRWGGKGHDGTWYGAMAEVVYGRANVTLASLIFTMERLADFDTTRHYMTNAVCWVVPRAKQIPQWQSLFMIFSPMLWICTLTVVLVVAIVFRYEFTCKDLKTSLLLSLEILLGISVNPQSRKNLLFAFYIFYCLLINAAYQSCLISFLTEPSYFKQITTEKEVIASDKDIHTCCGYDQFLIGEPVLKRVTMCESHQQCLNEVINNDIIAICDKALVSDILSSSYRDDHGPSMVVILSDNILLYHVSMMLPKGSILLERFNQIIDRINEAGLMFKWRKDLSQLTNTTQTHQLEESISGPKHLTLKNLQGAFIILVVGHISALLTILGEIIKFRTT